MRTLALSALCFLLACATTGAPAPTTPDPEAASALLVEYQQLLRQLAEGGDVQQVVPTVDGLDAKAAQLHDGRRLGRDFFDRYRRILVVTRATAMPATEESTKVVADFVRDVEGREMTGEGLASVAPAIVEELLNLHQILEPKEERDALRGKYFPAP